MRTSDAAGFTEDNSLSIWKICYLVYLLGWKKWAVDYNPTTMESFQLPTTKEPDGQQPSRTAGAFLTYILSLEPMGATLGT